MRARVTDIEEFRRYKASEEYELGALLSRLRREEPPSVAMRAGTALHSILENGLPGIQDAAKQDGFTFVFSADIELAMSPLRELAGSKVIAGIEVAGKVDEIGGFVIADHKLTSRFDPERYTDSAQWRLYLDIFGADRFVYNVFEASSDDDERFVVFGFHRLPLYRYPGMEEENARLVSEYAAFAREHLESSAA